MKLLTSLLLLLGVQECSAQDATSFHKTYEFFHLAKANDSDGILDAGMVYSIRLNAPPKGAGSKDEVSQGNHLFPEENNVAWFRFKALKTSRLSIQIIPDSTKDDYDFLLFEYAGAASISAISRKQQKPLRSNCARTQHQNEGKTGLSYSRGNPEHVRPGIGSAYSDAIEVERGEEYILVLNNVYDEGAGAKIIFQYWDEKELSGTIKDEKETPLSVVVTWEDRATGDTLASTTSDEKGYFNLTVPYSMQSENGYTLVASSDTLVFDEKEYTVGQIATCSPEPLSLVLTELKKGKRMTFGSINFVPGKPVFLKSAYPSLRRLHKLMKANPHMKIQIEGHTHGTTGTTQKLSEDRAEAVNDYLINKGIALNRMTTIGHSGKYMLYPYNSRPELASKNRRVEVMVTSY